MTNLPQIPEVEDSGSSGEQKVGSEELIPPEQLTPFEREPVATTLQGLAENNARSLGGENFANLMAANYRQTRFELVETKTALSIKTQELKEVQEGLTNCRIENANLSGKISSIENSRHFRSFAIFAGTALLGVAFELAKENESNLFWAIGAIGILFIIFGWFWRLPGANK